MGLHRRATVFLASLALLLSVSVLTPTPASATLCTLQVFDPWTDATTVQGYSTLSCDTPVLQKITACIQVSVWWWWDNVQCLDTTYTFPTVYLRGDTWAFCQSGSHTYRQRSAGSFWENGVVYESPWVISANTVSKTC